MPQDLSQFLGGQPKKRGGFTQLLDFFKEAGVKAEENILRGTGNIAGTLIDAINPVTYLGKAMGVKTPTIGQKVKDLGNWAGDQVEQGSELLSPKTNSTGERLGGATGEVLGNIASQVPFLFAGGEALSGAKALASTKGLGKLKSVPDFLLKSLGTTTTQVASNEGRLPSAKEAAGYSLLDFLGLGLVKSGSAIYQTAFRGTGKQGVNYLKEFGETLGQTAEKLGYTGTASKIAGEASANAKSVWAKLLEKAQTAKEVLPEEFDSIKTALLKDYDNLPDSPFKLAVTKEISDIVEQYRPTGAITGDQIVNTIKQINKGLFKDGQTTVLSLQDFNSLESKLKSELKDLLPAEVKPLYKDYSINKTIEDVMKDAEVQKMLGRALLGGTVGAGSGITAGIASGQSPIEIAKNAILFGILGSIAPKALTSTYGLTKVGKSTQLLGKFGILPTKSIISNILKRLNSTFPEKESTSATSDQQESPEARPQLQTFLEP